MDKKQAKQTGPNPENSNDRVEELKEIIEALKSNFRFKRARKALSMMIANETDTLWFRQQLALCTYKDHEMAPALRFAEALRILEEIGLRDPETKNAETLNLGGAVYKRMWEHGGQIEHLYESLAFYRAAFERNPEDDLGYGGINAAYILDVLSARARAAANRSGTSPVEADAFARQAADFRGAVIERLAKAAEKHPSRNEENWFAVTLAEAHYGLENYAEAGKWLAVSRALEASEWERQTTFRQLVAIARLQGKMPPPEKSDPKTWDEAWRTLVQLLGDDTEAALSCYRGKVGLSLSGGGFRASLYHIGVLARLAEMDVLRSVEVLSTVSGGSIVGAHYYLEVKHLLENKADSEITREDYIDIVRRVQENFLAGLEKNIRMLALSDFKKNLSMMASANYGRSNRLGELYEEILYACVDDGRVAGTPRKMADLLIQPQGEPAGFNPKFSNWRRRARVPALLLNATSLNTGHNWRFTARSMGEPPGLLGEEVDKNARYRRLYYDQAPTEALKNYRLGYAVAASACVPGLFDPLTLEGLYEDKVVRLVDGGVHDNQGVAGLLDEACDFILTSDASGQMDDRDRPADGIPAVLLRSNSIIMDRVRETEFEGLKARLDSRALQGLFFVHLKKDLHVKAEDWIRCQDPTPPSGNGEADTPYGVDPKIQRLLAAIRTDLDSFTEVEAYALMATGYLMTEQQFEDLQALHEKSAESGTWGGFDISTPREDWRFLGLAPLMGRSAENDPARQDLEKQLKAAASLAFKIWKLDNRLKIASWIAAGAAAVTAAALIRSGWDHTVTWSVGGIVLTAALALGAMVLPMLNWLFPEKAVRRWITRIAVGFFGYLAAKFHLNIFDRMFIARGRLARLLAKQKN